jgi:hypothetical protein
VETTSNHVHLLASKAEASERTDESQGRMYETLTRIERELEHLREGMGLLGVKSCSWCKKFFLASEPGALFDCGELVCYDCIREWWPHRSGELSAMDREAIERKLVRWLLNHRRAEVVRHAGQPPNGQAEDLRLVAVCTECEGAGTLLGARCRYCDGRGTVWVVIPKTET